ncbi:MAG: hypothetical protein ABI461_13675 [Polyangiaceae bacterium]
MKTRAPLFLLVFPLSAALASCSSCSHKSSSDSNAALVLSPVDPPAGLLAEVTITNPDAFWGHLQHGTGGLVALLPMTLGGLVTTFGSVDPSLATAVDGASPAYAAAVARGATETGWAFAAKLTDLPHARAILVDGESAHYDAHDDGIFTILSRKGGTLPGAPPGPQIAISSNGNLVIADDVDDLKAIGSYLVRTMPTHARGGSDVEIDVPHAALAGPLHDRLAAFWSHTRQEKEAQAKEAKDKHGRDADFGDPNAILTLVDAAVQKRLGLVTDLQNTHISIGADATSITVDATLTPNDGEGPAAKWISGLTVGDATPLLDAPAGVVTVMNRSAKPVPLTAAADFESALKSVLGARLNDADAKLAQSVAVDFSAGAGDVVTASFVNDETGLGALLVTPAARSDAALRSVHEGFELLDRPAFRAPLTALVGVTGSALGTAEIGDLGHATTYTAKRGTTDLASAAWLVHDGTLMLGAGSDGAKFLTAFAHPPRLWRSDAAVAARATALGSGISLAIVAHPFPASDPLASLFFAWGRDHDRGHASVETADVVLREAIRLFSR